MCLACIKVGTHVTPSYLRLTFKEKKKEANREAQSKAIQMCIVVSLKNSERVVGAK